MIYERINDLLMWPQTGLSPVLTSRWGNSTKLCISPGIKKEHWANHIPWNPLLTFDDNCRVCICFLLLWKKEVLPGFSICLMNSSFSPITVGNAILAATEPQDNTAKDIPSYVTSFRPWYEPLQHVLICLVSCFPLFLHPWWWEIHCERSLSHKEELLSPVKTAKLFWCIFSLISMGKQQHEERTNLFYHLKASSSEIGKELKVFTSLIMKISRSHT